MESEHSLSLVTANVIQDDILAKKLEVLREKLTENERLYTILEIFQHRREEGVTADDIQQAFGRTMQDDESTLDVFKEEFLKLVKKVEGLEHITVGDFPHITSNVWENRKSNNQVALHLRRDILSKWKVNLTSFMSDDEGKCSDPKCCRRKKDYHERQSGGWHGSHQNASEKTNNPAHLAQKKDGSYLKEIVEDDNGVLIVCSTHHDKADVSRGKALPDIKSSKIILTEGMSRHDDDGNTNHLTLANELKDPNRVLKHTSYHIDGYLRGFFSATDYCDYDTKRIVDDAHWSSEGDIILTDDFSLWQAKDWDKRDNNRDVKSLRTLGRIMVHNSGVCYGADELVSEEAVQRRANNETMTEDDYVCKSHDFCFKNLAPSDYMGISGDHDNDATKNFHLCNGWGGVDIFKQYDELVMCPWHCNFCHSVRTSHQEKGKCTRCYYLN